MKKIAGWLFVMVGLLLVIAILPFTNAQATGEEIVEDGIIYEIVDGEAWVTGGDPFFDGSLYIPAKVNGHSVIGIKASAFQNYTSIQNVTIGRFVTVIEANAFMGCSNLTSLSIPDSVTTIGEKAFYGCKSLSGVGMGRNLRTVGDLAFGGCDQITAVFVPDLEIYRKINFEGTYSDPMCYGVDLYVNGSLYHELYLPAGMTKIEDQRFMYNRSLNTVIIPEGVTHIGKQAFAHCIDMTKVVIPDSVIFIDDAAFMGCTALKTVVIGSGITELPSRMLKDCVSLTSIEIPANIVGIGSDAFKGSGLSEITIPSGIQTISEGAFTNCNALQGVYISDLAAWCEIEFADSGANPLSVSHNLYLNGTRPQTLAIPSGVKTIGDYAFSGGTQFTSVTFSSDVTQVGKDPFEGCSALTEVRTTDLAAWCQIDFALASSNPAGLVGSLYVNGTPVRDLIIPEGVTKVGDYAFYGNQELRTVTVPSGLTSVGKDAFGNCWYLDSVFISDLDAWYEVDFATAASNPVAQAHYLYVDFGLITDLVVPSDRTQIKAYTFYGCSTLTSVTIPSGIAAVGKDAFGGCTELTGVFITDLQAWYEIDFASEQANPTYYANHLYLDGAPVTELTPPEDITQIKDYSFINCQDITVVALGDSITGVGVSAFSGCSSITEVAIGKNLIQIGENAFFECENTQKVHVPDMASWSQIKFANKYSTPVRSQTSFYVGGLMLQEIELPYGTPAIFALNYANNYCLKRIVIPDTVTFIETTAFENCGNLTEIVWGNGLQVIDAYAFPSCTSLSSLILPDSVTYIGGFAFANCSNLRELKISDGVTSLDDSVFQQCKNLTDVTLPANLEYLGSAVFVNCDSLEKIVLPDTVTAIGCSTFYGCDSLRDITIPDGVIQIGEGAFYGCTNLNSLSIPDSVMILGARQYETLDKGYLEFYENGVYMGNENNPYHALVGLVDKNITEFSIHPQTKVLGGGVFYNCTGLTEITLPEGIVSICDGAFERCVNLRTVVMGDEISYIGQEAFYNCTSLTSFVVPRKVSVIESYAFSKCTGLRTITLPQGLNVINECAFYGCTDLETITLPSQVETIELSAFKDCTALSSIRFMGSKPYFAEHTGFIESVDNNEKELIYVTNDAFRNVTAEAAYPADDPSWEGQEDGYAGDITWVAWNEEVTTPTVGLKYPTASFEDEIILNVYFSAVDMEDVVQMGMIVYDERPSEPLYYTADYMTYGYTIDPANDLYLVSSQGIAAKDMTRQYYMAVYAKLTDGSYAYSSVFRYSISDYAQGQLKNGTQQMKELMAATLIYGNAAQRYFGIEGSQVEVDTSLVESYRTDMMNAVVKAESSKLGRFTKTDPDLKGYPSISFEGAFSINYYFKTSGTVNSDVQLYYWTAEAYNRAEELTADNATGVLWMQALADGSYQAAVTGIAAKDLDNTIYVACVYSDGQAEYCSGVLAYSIGTYCSSQAVKTGPLAEFAAATAVYGYYAKQMFR